MHSVSPAVLHYGQGHLPVRVCYRKAASGESDFGLLVRIGGAGFHRPAKDHGG